ncbi:hypothetical protein F5Y06DRAFT_269318 [Hypoxylon sp. FL0890]|nr:hypothetical protein F5Y06DRAFT_269318 [Hypoxylon sp. FL0890]
MMADSGSYKPPFSRSQATREPRDSQESSGVSSGHRGSSFPQRANNRGGRSNMRGQGFAARRGDYAGRAGYAGRGDHAGRGDFNGRGGYAHRGDRGYRGNGYRGGRGRGRGSNYNNNFFQARRNHEQPQDQSSDGAELYSQHDIENHFWGEGEDLGVVHHSTTFHDSQTRPGKLAYVQLFFGANPRWTGDHIIFAKSNLNLLPEYSAKKAERGEWETPKAADAAKVEETQTQPVTTGNTDGVNDAGTAKPAVQNGEVSSSPTAVASEATTEENKTEEVATADATKGDEASQPAKQPSPVPSGRMLCSDIRNLPPEELQRLEEARKQRLARQQRPPSPDFPAIEPIDFTPGEHGPVAVFEERRFPNAPSRFAFVGWYKVARINILAPHSAELVRMQQQKWERRDRFGNIVPTKTRDAAAWNAALSTEWAVVKLEKLEGDDAPAPPEIKKLSEHPVGAEAEMAKQQEAQTEAAGEGGSDGDKPVTKADADADAAPAKADTESKLGSTVVAETDASQQDTVTVQLSKMRVEDEEAKIGATTGNGDGAPGGENGSTAEADQVEGSDKDPDAVARKNQVRAVGPSDTSVRITTPL